jgi:predicted nuclease with TOPRIM domain
MLKYFNEIVICNSLDKENKELKEKLNRLQQDYNDLEYKYNGVLDCKKEIYTKYQDTIIRKDK